jgi:hypothetical protein
MTTTIRITASTNSEASSARSFAAKVLPGLAIKSARHNGGKLVIVDVLTSELAAAETALDAAYSVSAYEVVS